MGSQRQLRFPDRADDALVVRYSGRYALSYAARILPFFAIFVVIAALYLDDESRAWFFSRGSARHKPFSWFEFGFLLALVTAPLADLFLTLRRVRSGAFALAISKDGITGPVFHIRRLLTWDDIADVTADRRFLTIRRRFRSPLLKLFAHRGLGDINIPTRHLDRDAADVLAAAQRFAPLSTRVAAAS